MSFAAASVLCGLAPSAGWLIGFRLIQGVGGAILASVGPAIITEVFPAHELGRALGLNSAAWVVGNLLGPVFGGLIVVFAGWPAVFFVVVPFAVVASALGYRYFPRTTPRRTGQAWEWSHFDLPGMLLITVALTCLLLALAQGVAWGWLSWPMGTLYGLTALSLIAFIYQESRATHPLFDLALFRVTRFTLAQLALFFGAVGIGAIAYLMTDYLQGGLALTPVLTGLLLIPLAAPQLVTSPLGGLLSDRTRHPEAWIVLGFVLITGAELFLANLPFVGSTLFVVLVLGTIGAANGAWFPPLLRVVMSSAPRHSLGAASGMFFTVRNTAYALSLTLALVFAELGLSPSAQSLFTQSQLPKTPALKLTLISSVRGAFLGFALITALAVLTSIALLAVQARRVPAPASVPSEL